MTFIAVPVVAIVVNVPLTIPFRFRLFISFERAFSRFLNRMI